MTRVERLEAALDLACELQHKKAEIVVTMAQLVTSIRRELRLARQEQALIDKGGSLQDSEP